ncbi:Hypothetical protein NTJ_10046 [Nesidiocoris tenuis]|uniref:Uncharacterized protein n=1 Tax=Nesidiocoris tenuis TaxID=355587 RepID=A0ABN7B0T7_9HEMI|nr:Hypothetical protein NTJ_10046 [Nesidiocoris tenuis]
MKIVCRRSDQGQGAGSRIGQALFIKHSNHVNPDWPCLGMHRIPSSSSQRWLFVRSITDRLENEIVYGHRKDFQESNIRKVR